MAETEEKKIVKRNYRGGDASVWEKIGLSEVFDRTNPQNEAQAIVAALFQTGEPFIGDLRVIKATEEEDQSSGQL